MHFLKPFYFYGAILVFLLLGSYGAWCLQETTLFWNHQWAQLQRRHQVEKSLLLDIKKFLHGRTFPEVEAQCEWIKSYGKKQHFYQTECFPSAEIVMYTGKTFAIRKIPITLAFLAATDEDVWAFLKGLHAHLQDSLVSVTLSLEKVNYQGMTVLKGRYSFEWMMISAVSQSISL